MTSSSRILEIGTGTGWTTALLAFRARAENIVSVETRGDVAHRAMKALADHGDPVRVVIGDGLDGYPQRGLYDQVLATCAVHEIPFEWVQQSTPGGRIVAPWGTPYGQARAVVALTVDRDYPRATGRFVRPIEAPLAQTPRFENPSPARQLALPSAIATTTGTALTADDLLGHDQDGVQRFVLGLRLRDCTHAVSRQADGQMALWLYGLRDRSWACVAFREGASAKVWQSGHRQLWTEAKAAYMWWVEQGRPGYERLGLTVDAEGQKAWLDDPANSWPV
ncbi:protein-L-isoaspartate(D-aspartate) O-methyltransferase [Streptomyces griseus]|uniref:protein-L-isoaspartate(D-aspartate) O-methyltransferase n=1 Tax=Streptomyces griseus TaxID=1911 RepID=UPI0037AD81AE